MTSKLRSSEISPFRRVIKKIWADRISYLFLLPFAILFITFTVLPIFTAVFYSFTYNNIFEPTRWVGLANFIRLFSRDELFLTALQNTLVFALITGPAGYILSFVAAWLINELGSGLRTLFVLLFYAPSLAGSVYVIFTILFSGDIYGYVNGFLYKLGLIQQPIAWLTDPTYIKPVIMICVLWSSMGAGFLSFVAGFKNIDNQYYEAGALDGVQNRWQELWYITLPMLKPQLMFGAIMSITGAFSIGDVTSTLAGYPSTNNVATTIVNYMNDVGYARFELGYASAMAVVLFAMMYLARLLINKLLSRVGK
ncbi:MAG: sugar ABC transporter permease [Oscillospiraceae bacterium]